mgnify:CR=1 FL=1
MSTAPKARADLGLLVRREPDEDGPQFKPLEWGLILRLFTYTRPFARKRNALIVLTLIRSIHEQLFPLGDDVSFIPGHGPMSTFGEERDYNPFLSGRFG